MATNTLPEKCGVGTACPGCGQRLPLRFSERGEAAALWECAACLTPFAGILMPDMVAMLAHRVRLAQRHFDSELSQPLPPTLQEVIQRLHAAGPFTGTRDLRRCVRVAGMRHAVAVYLDARYGVSASAIRGTIANMSPHGILLLTGVPIDATAVVAQVKRPRSTLQLLANVIWARHLGGGCYGAGAELVARFGRKTR